MKKQILTKSTALISTVVIAAIAVFTVPQINYAQTTAKPLAAISTTSSPTIIDWPTAPTISAGSAILIDADTGAILYDKNSHTKAYPASVTKIMTGLLAIENCSFDEVVTFSPQAANSVKWDEANIATKVGEQYTVEQALYALLLSSANEVAYGIAEHVGTTLPNFVEMMNTRAKELGALNTHFNNASGLFDPNHYTTAYDMAMIGRTCFTNSTFSSIDSYIGYYKLGPTNLTNVVRSLSSKNLMFKNQQFYYEYCKGGKTGFTDESGYTLISYAVKDGMKLICVTMKESKPDDRYIDTKALFEYGFNNFKKISVSNSDVSSLFNSSNYYSSKVYGDSKINFSMDASYIDLPNSATISDVGLTLENNASNDTNSQYDYTAKLNFMYNGNIVGNANLLVNTDSSVVKSYNLPYLSANNSSTPTSKQCFVINVWYVAITVGIVLLVYYIFISIKRARRTKKSRKYSKRKLYY